LVAAEYHGQVTFGGLPVPGATVTAARDDKKFVTTTNEQGRYSLTDLTDGHWSIEIKMLGFGAIQQDVVIAPGAPAGVWELKMLPLGQIKAQMEAAPTISGAAPIAARESQPQAEAKKASEAESVQEDLSRRAADGFLINGSVNNAAASPFSQAAAFGNRRTGGRSLYNGGIGITFDNSALNARPFSLTGQDTPKAAYNRMTGLLALGGPLRIPHLLQNGPNVFVGYQWTRNRNATTQSALMPDAAERHGDFSQSLASSGRQILDPTTGLPFPENRIPANAISPQAQALLRFYPLPNFNSNAGYNYQSPLISSTHEDALQSRFNKNLAMRDQIYGGFAFQSTRTDNPNLFGFLDTTDTLGLNTSVNWYHRFSHRLFLNLGYRFSRFSTHVTPYFENRENVSGLAGISGNNQDPSNWGPPSLVFSSGIAGLSDSQSAFNRNQTGGVSYSMLWNHGAHNFSFGGDFLRQQFNNLSQQDPRGTFTFTGASSGVDFADFLIGIPDTSSIAFGNADKYFRESVYDAYFTDDWRISPEFSLNAGIRWEYGAPITELYGRLVNLDIAPGFSAVAPVVANNPVGPLTGQNYPSSLIHPDKNAFEPRIGLAWRPLSGSSLVVRAGYGMYSDMSVYQTIASQMAQQAPLSKSLSVQNSAANPLTLANGFNASPVTTPNTFAIDPNFRVGYAQNWQLAVQRDLPASLQMTATYLGIKGTRGMQEFLPNTFPTGAVNPCQACPAGFAYLSSNGNSTFQAVQFQLRRRLHNGLTGILQYTFSKSIDDDAALGGQAASAVPQNNASQSTATPVVTGGAATPPPAATGQQNLMIAQNWLDLSAERSLSTFDQRHLLTVQLQYTTGMGVAGGMLLTGWKGALLKEWTFATEITAGSGLPQTPVYLAPVQGTGVTGTIRPDYTGQPLYASPAGFYLNPAAYSTPVPGQWGNAGRNSITGPAQFTLNASFGRTFRVSDRFNLDFRVDSTNVLNHVTFTTWNTTINSTQFGLPAAANAMRSLQTTLRLRF
ncbi:MAG TPA: carboxypeptidase regulatory-like domain-containing protein, partial [Bryobacteraceae bacterium]|nr:carboxypeptidase regulatory-like domain-containing protein [Bryobacteraceae bacterium]